MDDALISNYFYATLHYKTNSEITILIFTTVSNVTHWWSTMNNYRNYAIYSITTCMKFVKY